MKFGQRFVSLTRMQTDHLDELLVCRLDSGRKAVEPASIVIFGASGDLTGRKLIPALYNLFCEKRLPPAFRIIGFARRPKSDESWREELLKDLERFSRTPVQLETWREFSQSLTYCQGDFSDPGAYQTLKRCLEASPNESLRRNLLFYLAILPSQFAEVVQHMHQAGLIQKQRSGPGWERVVVEKPFGHDLASARQLNAVLTQFLSEAQIFRIDHYLGKETVQNILLFRFSNSIFEHLWNRQVIDHLQITVSEKLGVGSRGGYYEEAGALRDMVQNHLLQVLSLVAMEPPVSLEAESIRDEKVKVLRAIAPLLPEEVATNVVRGQYVAGEVDGVPRSAYRREEKVKPESNVETFVALKLMINNWRWAGVPVYLRTGKSLAASASEVRVQFRAPPSVLFAAQCGLKLDANAITLRLQPDEGISLRFNGKVPGNSLQLRPVRMHFSYDTEFGAYTPEAYERLLLEALAGDATLFIRRDEVETAWTIVDSIRQAWGDRSLTERDFYPAGSWGPAAAEELLARDGQAWRNPAATMPAPERKP